MAKTKELKKRSWGIEEGEESSRQFWKELVSASGSSFQRAVMTEWTPAESETDTGNAPTAILRRVDTWEPRAPEVVLCAPTARTTLLPMPERRGVSGWEGGGAAQQRNRLHETDVKCERQAQVRAAAFCQTVPLSPPRRGWRSQACRRWVVGCPWWSRSRSCWSCRCTVARWGSRTPCWPYSAFGAGHSPSGG